MSGIPKADSTLKTSKTHNPTAACKYLWVCYMRKSILCQQNETWPSTDVKHYEYHCYVEEGHWQYKLSQRRRMEVWLEMTADIIFVSDASV